MVHRMADATDLSGLIKWMQRPEWREDFQEVFDAHIGAACEAAGVEMDRLGELLGDHTAMVLFGCAFEDFTTHVIDEPERNIVDDYLKRRGWKESVINKRYMTALRDSEMSLYEVSEVLPGQSFLARDMLRGGPPVRVSEQTATKTLRQWDRLATRIVELNGKHVMSGGSLPLAHQVAEQAMRAWRAEKRRARRTVKEAARDFDKNVEPDAQKALADILVASSAPPLFSAIWLEDALNRVLRPTRPHMVNFDGDDIEFCKVRFPLRPDATAEAVSARLDGVAVLERDDDSTWTWTDASAGEADGPRPPGKATAARGAPSDPEDITLGTVELREKAVVLSTNSRARATRGEALLAPVLDGLTGAALTEIETVDQMIAARPAGTAPAKSTIPPEIEAQIVQQFLDKHYRAQLDLPVPMLGNISPRDAARSASGRKKLVEWLKYLENGPAIPQAAGNPVGNYDFGWMWAELGVAALRK